MRAQVIELGERVVRAMVIENSGPPSRRMWLIARNVILARLSRAA